MTWLDYSSASPTIQRALNQSVFLAVGCFLIGCHIDRANHAIKGPTTEEFAQQQASSLIALAIPLEMPSAAFSLQERASALHNLLPKETQGFTTTVVVSAQAEDGSVINIVASSEQRLRPAQRAALYADEIEAIGSGHAEVTALDYAEAAGLKPLAVAASRPICPPCADAILKSGALRITRLRMR